MPTKNLFHIRRGRWKFGRRGVVAVRASLYLWRIVSHELVQLDDSTTTIRRLRNTKARWAWWAIFRALKRVTSRAATKAYNSMEALCSLMLTRNGDQNRYWISIVNNVRSAKASVIVKKKRKDRSSQKNCKKLSICKTNETVRSLSYSDPCTHQCYSLFKTSAIVGGATWRRRSSSCSGARVGLSRWR